MSAPFILMPGDDINIKGVFMDAVTGIQFEPYGPTSSAPTSSPTGPETPATPLTSSDFTLVDNANITVPGSTVSTLFALNDLDPDTWYKVVLLNNSSYQPNYLIAGRANFEQPATARSASAGLLNASLAERDAQTSTLYPPNIIPTSQYSVSHWGWNANGTQAIYAGPAWTAGSDVANMTTVAKAPLWGGTAAATGKSTWSNTRYYQLQPRSNVITTSYAGNFMWTFVFKPPSTTGGDWTGDPWSGNTNGAMAAFLFELGQYQNGGYGHCEIVIVRPPGASAKLQCRIGGNTGDNWREFTLNTDSPTPHVFTIAQGVRPWIYQTIRMKLDTGSVSYMEMTNYNWYISAGNGPMMGTSYYYLDQNLTRNTWSDGVFYEARFCTMPSLATDADLDALHASIMV